MAVKPPPPPPPPRRARLLRCVILELGRQAEATGVELQSKGWDDPGDERRSEVMRGNHNFP